MKLISLLLLTLFLSACNFGESPEEIAAKKLQEKKAFEEKIAAAKEVQLKKIDAQKEQELAKIESQTTLAKLEKEQLLEKIKLEAEAKKESFEAKLRDLERADSMEIKRYLLLILFLLLVIISYFVYLYFKRKHDDQLRAYQDNLNKYFHQQENMTRMRIAEKIIDTVASGKLAKEQESELIKALSGNIQPSQEPKLLTETTEDAQIVQESKK
ncbi:MULTISPECIES: hypothetical protein [Sulfurimonas]|uniref:hypothetical protein n=1 Tax=Sulfurimonas TaxID=202746 RepID=UPI0012640D51|nr:hypothetical protein [Sulfurimonas indica]